MNNMEIELRAKILEPKTIEQNLKLLPGIVEKKSNDRQIDTYLKHENDKDRKLVIRLRKNYTNNKATLTFKGKSKGKLDIAWQDYDTPIENPDILEKVLINNGYEYVCLIDKVRQSFVYEKFEINIDNIRDLGLFIEIEKYGEEGEVEKIKNELTDLLNKLGIKNEDIVTQGYVQLVLNKK